MSMNKAMKDGMPAINHTQNFKGSNATHIINPSHANMPMSRPQTMKMAQGNTFQGMPAYPNQTIFEGLNSPWPVITKTVKDA